MLAHRNTLPDTDAMSERPALFGGLLFCITILIACSASPTDPCPVDEPHCDFAAELHSALQSGDTQAIVALSKPSEYICPGPRERTPDLGLVCSKAAAGEVRSGYPILRLGAQNGALDKMENHELLLGWADIGSGEEVDRYGSGTLRLATLGCTTRPEKGCGQSRGVVFTARDNGRTRAAFWFVITARPKPMITAVAIGQVPNDCRLSDALPCRLIEGGDIAQPLLAGLTGYEVVSDVLITGSTVRFTTWTR